MFSIPPILFDSDENNNAALVDIQPHAYENVDTCKDIPLLPIESTIVVQCQDAGLWMHRTIVGHGSDYHCGRNSRISMTKTGCKITRTKRHMKATQSEQRTA